jgi:integrase
MNKLDTVTIAKELGTSTRTIQNYCKSGFLPSETQWFKGKVVYLVDAQDYQNWRHKYFRGIKKGEISLYKSNNRELGKNDLREHVPEWLEWCSSGKLGGKPCGSRMIELYNYYLNYYFNKLGRNPKLPIISLENFRKVLGLIPIESFSTRMHVYSAVRSFSKYLIEINNLKPETRDQIKKLRPKRFLPAKKTVLNKTQLKKIIDYLEINTSNSRYCNLLNLTLVQFLVNTGLRAGELCNLTLKDIDLELGIVYVWLGKGNKNRKVGIPNSLKPILKNYLKVRTKYSSEYFFVGRGGTKLTPEYLCKRLKRISQYLDIEITPHGLRRTFVTLNVNEGRQLVHLQIACGHSDIGTTRGYCMTTEDEVIEAMKGW